MTDPIRKCILTQDRDVRDNLVRLAIAPDGQVLPDVRAKAPGRGAWIGVTRAELDEAIAKKRLRGALARAFKGAELVIPDDLPARIASALERNALDRLGLESRSGLLLTGSEKIETAARSGQLHALYHAADAGTDGNRKLDQAWRIGSDREGSDIRGLVLPVSTVRLSPSGGRVPSDGLSVWSCMNFLRSTSRPCPCLAKRPRKAHRRTGYPAPNPAGRDRP